MKLSELRSAIRKMKGNPSVVVELTPGKPMTLVLQKTPTLETLGTVYDGITGDIGLSINDDGVISGEKYVHSHLELSGVANADFAAHEDPLDLEDDEDML